MRQNSKTKNMQFLRITNRATIMKYLVMNGHASRVELSSHLGLSKMAISSIITDLIHEGLVSENGQSEFRQVGSGRKSNSLIALPKKINAIGVLIRRHEVHCLSIDIHGNINSHSYQYLDENADNDYLITTISTLVDNIIAENSELKYSGIGIASIGPLDISKRTILEPPNLRQIRNLDIGDILEEQYQIPVLLDNDMNACALAENLYGAAKFMNNIAYIGFSNGVGAGIIVDGKILHGMEGFAAEVGHLSIAMDGPLCICGRQGCVEMYTSIPNLLNNTGVDSINSLENILNGDIVPKYVSDSFNLFLKSIESLLTSMVNIFDPEVIVIGDRALPLISPHIKDLEVNMNRLKFNHSFKNTSVVSSAHREMTPFLGSSAIIFDKIFNGQIDLSQESFKK